MSYLLPLALGYFLGCSNLAYFIGRLRRQDIRKQGSGNLGASNATVLFGWTAGVSVALHDIGKAFLAVYLGRWLFPELTYAGAAAGMAAVMGHMFPFYLKFRGGKGLASYFGAALALNWPLALGVAVLIFLATVITDFIAIGTLTCITVIPVYLAVVQGDWTVSAIFAAVSAVMFCKHWENIGRIIRKEEIGLRSTMRGEKRIR